MVYTANPSRNPGRSRVGSLVLPVKLTHVFLALLVIHQTAISLVRFSRVARVSKSVPSHSPGALSTDGTKLMPVYNAATAIFLTECLKAMISGTILTIEVSSIPLALFIQKHDSKATSQLPSALKIGVIIIGSVIGPKQLPHLINMALPGLLYTVQNNLLYIALSNLDTPTFLVTSQLKILSTALFSVVLFNRHLSGLQWVSLVFLTIGVSLVQLRPKVSTGSSYSSPANEQDWFKGLVCIIFSCLSSGLAGCWFEMIVKKSETTPSKSTTAATISTNTSYPSLQIDHQTKAFESLNPPLSDSLWVKNLQLSCFTIPFAFLAIYLDPRSYKEVTTKGFFSGYGPLVWSVILYHAVGGILVSIIVKQSSTVTKSFANSLSIVLSTLLSSCITGVVPGYHYLFGTALVIASTRMYSSKPAMLSESKISKEKDD